MVRNTNGSRIGSRLGCEVFRSFPRATPWETEVSANVVKTMEQHNNLTG